MNFEIHECHLKTIKKMTKLPDTYFLAKYSFSPYRACHHGCAYCDGRAERYYVEGDFEKDIEARINTPNLLDQVLCKSRERGFVSIGSGVSDPYQQADKSLKLMRNIAEVVLKRNFSCSVMTKSSLVARDIDLWERVNDKNRFFLMMSVTSVDDAVSNLFEPNATSMSNRLKTLRLFKERGIPVGALMMPVLPRISDTKESMDRLIDELCDIGVDVIFPGTMTLRPGRQKDFFMDVLKRYYPEHVSYYEHLYSENRPSGSPLDDYSEQVMQYMGKAITAKGIPTRVPHSVYQGHFQAYDELFILLQHMTLLYKYRGYDTKALKRSFSLYKEWLLETKATFNRQRKQGDFLDSELRLMFQHGDFVNIIKNEKLFEFLKKVILEGKTFDYQRLKLT